MKDQTRTTVSVHQVTRTYLVGHVEAPGGVDLVGVEVNPQLTR